MFRLPVWFWVLKFNLSTPSLIRMVFGSLCCPADLVVPSFPNPIIHLGYVPVWACVPFHCSVVTRWKPIGFTDFVSFGCFEKAVYIVNNFIVIVIQQVSHREKNHGFIVFRLFGSQKRKFFHRCHFFECLWMIQEIVDF